MFDHFATLWNKVLQKKNIFYRQINSQQNKCFFKEFFWIFLMFCLLKSFAVLFLKSVFYKNLSKKSKEPLVLFSFFGGIVIDY